MKHTIRTRAEAALFRAGLTPEAATVVGTGRSTDVFCNRADAVRPAQIALEAAGLFAKGSTLRLYGPQR